MRLTQEIIDKIAIAMQHTKKDGTVNWKDGDEIDVCVSLNIANDKFITIINRSKEKMNMWYVIGWTIVTLWLLSKLGVFKNDRTFIILGGAYALYTVGMGPLLLNSITERLIKNETGSYVFW